VFGSGTDNKNPIPDELSLNCISASILMFPEIVFFARSRLTHSARSQLSVIAVCFGRKIFSFIDQLSFSFIFS